MANMTEKELLTDLLNEEKNLLKQYAFSITEASCINLRQLFNSHLVECGQDQFSVFSQMNQRNMYPTKSASTQEVEQASQQSADLKQQTGM